MKSIATIPITLCKRETRYFLCLAEALKDHVQFCLPSTSGGTLALNLAIFPPPRSVPNPNLPLHHHRVIIFPQTLQERIHKRTPISLPQCKPMRGDPGVHLDLSFISAWRLPRKVMRCPRGLRLIHLGDNLAFDHIDRSDVMSVTDLGARSSLTN